MTNIFYNQEDRTKTNRRHLPHWQQSGKLYFVTFRLDDSIPVNKLKELYKQQQVFIAKNPQPYNQQQQKQYNYLFNEKINIWLDNCYGQCLLAQEELASIVQNAIEYFEYKKYILDHWVIMPNHVHIIILLLENFTLNKILHSWKSYTAREINKATNRTGQLWQHESFDHIVRSPIYLQKYREYIIKNKDKAGDKALLSTSSIPLD
ncbi:MAG: transposase [Phycisphaerae bacterium]|nr:transposase [Phycisphaerae bacterium]